MLWNDIIVFHFQVLGQVDKKFIACVLDTRGSGKEIMV